MKKRTSRVSRRIVSLLMSMVLTLTLVTPAAFATEVVGGSGTAIIEGNANPADPAPGEDSENNEDKNTEDGKDEQPTEPDDEDKVPSEGEGDDANKPDEDKKDEAPDGENKDEENKDEQPTEDENNGEDDISLLNDENGTDVWVGTIAEKFAGGTGTESDPYQISNGAELAYLAQQVNGGTTYAGSFFTLTADIQLNNDAVPTSGNQWTPIGKPGKFRKPPIPFSGAFDGQGHTVSGLYIESTATCQGLFGYIGTGATVQNLIVTGTVSVNSNIAGGIAGKVETGVTVTDCGFRGTVSALAYVGGIVGNCAGTVINCYNLGSVSGIQDSPLNVAGGIVGNGSGATVSNCYNFGTVNAEGSGTAGGIVGSGTAQNCYYLCKVNGEDKSIYVDGTGAEKTITKTGEDAKTKYMVDESELATLLNAWAKANDAAEWENSAEEPYAPVFKAASDAPTPWDGTVDTNWYDASKDTFEISTAAELAGLAALVNGTAKDAGNNSIAAVNFSRKTIKLTADIDLNSKEWTPIGTQGNPFKGEFDSSQHSVVGLKLVNSIGENGMIGLFGNISGGTVSNLTVSGEVSDDKGYAYDGGIAGNAANATILNCVSSVKITDTAGSFIGGIAGSISGNTTIKNCSYTGEMSGVDYTCAGGIVGQIEDSGKVQNSYAVGTLKVPADGSNTFAGGIVGYGGTAQNCYYLCKVSNEDKSVYVDGTGAKKDITKTGEGAETKYMVDESELVTLLNDWAKANDAAAWENSSVEPYAPVFKAEGDTPTPWNGTVDTNWYDASKDTFEISTAAELAGLTTLVNGTAKDADNNSIAAVNFSGKTIKLTADIDLNNQAWTPIGNGDSCAFSGTFDGDQHIICGLNVKIKSGSYAGLFGYVYDGTVENLTAEGSVESAGEAYIAGIVGMLDGESEDTAVKNCVSRVAVSETVSDAELVGIGGIVGFSYGLISDCLNEGSVTITEESSGMLFVGGIAGMSMGEIRDCRNVGVVTNSADASSMGEDFCVAAGIAGYNLGKVHSCANESLITSKGKACGIAPCDEDDSGESGSVANCYNLGNVTGVTAYGFGVSSGTAQNCYYLCKVNGEDKSVYMDAAGAEKAITKTGEGAETKYTVGESELVALLNEWAKANDATEWENSTEEPYAPVFKTASDAPEENKVTVTYYANGGTGSITDTVEKDAKYTIRDGSGFTCKGKKMEGWNTSADGTGTAYAFGQEITVSEDLKLYAVWKNIWEGSGTETDPYRIQTAEDWAEMQAQAAVYDNYTGVWFSLTASITLPEAYEPFGFSGNLDGGGHSITVQIPMSKEDGKRSRGLFSGITGGGKGAAVRNLTIEGSVTTYQYAGGLAGTITGSVTLENVVNRASVTENGIGYGVAGGLCGEYRASTLTVKNCRNEGAVTGHTAGGLVGSYNGTTAMDFSGCTNSGTVHGENAAAGLLGFNARTNDPSSSFTNCSNTGEIIASGRAAGIAVLSTVGKVEGCTNSGAITGDIAAGILCSGVAKRSVNTGKITGKTCGAGIAANNNSGYTWYTMEFCANFGKVTATAGIGVAKRAYGIASQGTVKNCFTYNNEAHVPVAGATGRNCIITNSYYLANSKDEFPSTMGGEYATLADFASGKVAWGVDGGTGDHAGWWTQDTAKGYPKLLPAVDKAQSYYRAQATCGTGGTVTLDSSLGYTSTTDADNAVYGPKDTKVTITATPKDNTIGLKSLTWTHNGQTDALPTKGTPNIVIPAESNVTIHAEFASVGPNGGGGYYYGGSGDGTGTGDKDDEGLQDGLNMDVEYDIKGLVLGAYAEWGSNGGNKSFQKWLEENPNVVRALLTNSLDNMATAAVGKKTDEAKDLAALLLASLNEHTGVDGKDGDTIAKALQKYIDSGSEEVFSAWLTGGGGMASGTYESIYGQYASSLAALADRLYSKWEASGTSMTFPVWLDSQQVSMDSLSENADEPDTDNTNDPQTSDAPDDVPDGQDTEGGASGNSVWEIIGTVVRENPILVWSIVAVIAALIIVGAVRRYHKVKRDEHDEK